MEQREPREAKREDDIYSVQHGERTLLRSVAEELIIPQSPDPKAICLASGELQCTVTN